MELSYDTAKRLWSDARDITVDSFIAELRTAGVPVGQPTGTIKPEIAAKWAIALESGVYPQTTGKLRRLETGESEEPAGFCCLGVLCELARLEGIVTSDVGSYGIVTYEAANNPEHDGSDSSLPEAVREWAGIGDSAGRIVGEAPLVGGSEKCDLASANDAGMTFAEIAKIVRERRVS